MWMSERGVLSAKKTKSIISRLSSISSIWYLIFNQLFYICSNHILEGGASAIAGKPADGRSTQLASQAVPKAFEADGIEGVGLHPVRWTKDSIARSILGRKAQNAQPFSKAFSKIFTPSSGAREMLTCPTPAL